MRVYVSGKVVATEERSYTTKDGRSGVSVSVYLAASDPRYKPDRISVDKELAPVEGETVGYWCLVTARAGQYGPYLQCRGVERVADPARPVPAATRPRTGAVA